MSSMNESDLHSYTVLYYKRKASKVHKSKGVSKMDGILTILPLPKASVILKDGDNTVFRGSVSEIAKRADSLQEDDIVAVGNYEVEVCDRIGGKSSAPLVARTTKPESVSNNTGLVARSSKGLRRPLHSSSRPLLPGQSKFNVVTPRNNSLKKPLVNGDRRLIRPAQPKPTKPPPTSSDDDDSDNDIKAMIMKENTQCLPLKRGLLSRKPAASTLVRTKVRKLVTSTTATSNSSMVSAAALNNIFVNAIGSPDVPHSIKTVLKPHQITGVSFLWNSLTGSGKAAKASPHVSNNHSFKGAILADEMGLGKTLMTIAVLCALHRQKRDRRFVVVCPSSLVTNWANEFDKWLGKASQPKRVVIKKGGTEATSQIKAWSNKTSEVLIISYDLFRMNSDLFGRHVNKPVACLVVDEGHRLKNTNGSLTLTALESLPCQARLCITATPIQNILSDFFTIANFVCPGVLGDLPTFRKDYERPISAANNKSTSKKSKQAGFKASRGLESVTETFVLRRLQKDILKTMLPPRNEVLVFCRPSAVQSKLYEQITTEHRSPNMKATSDALTSLVQLRKLCSHPALLQNDKDMQSNNSGSIVDASGKLQVLAALLQQIREKAPTDKVVIVSNFTSALSLIEKSILGPHNHPFIRLDGTTEVKKRQEAVDTFNMTSADRHFVFLLSSKAGGCGLNLIGANRLVMFDPDWNPASDIQAMARVYRQGQTKPCFIYRLFTTGTVEEVICQRQIQKGNLATRAVDGKSSQSSGSKTTTSFSKAELQDCFTLKRNIVHCDTKTKVGKRWPEYTSATSIVDNGCDDQALIAVAEEESNPVSFVHVVKEADMKKGDGSSRAALDSDSDDSDDAEDQQADFSSEEEFE